MKLVQSAGLLFAMTAAMMLAPAAQAAMPKLQLQPVTPLGYSGDVLRLKVSLPCGSRFYGIVVSGDSQTKVMQIAAAVTEGPIVCTSMPETVEIGVDYLATHAYRKIAPMAVFASNRIVTVPVDEIRLTTGSAKSPTSALYAVYAPHCGLDQGALVHRHGKGQLEIAFIEASDSRHKLGACSAVPKGRRLSTLALTAGYTIKPLQEQTRSVAKAFTLHLASVRSAATTPAGMSVTYRRGCNEAPIGVVLHRLKADDDRVKVGVLVARYTNLSCPRELAASQWETLVDSSLTTSRDTTLDPMSDADSALALNLRTPTDLELAVDGSGQKTLRIKFIAGCGDTSTVYTHDNQGILAIGVLTTRHLAEDAEGRCQTAPVTRSLTQPYLAAQMQAERIYPLRLKGM